MEREGFTTRTAATARRGARASLAERLPDVVLTDLVLPDGNGLELLKRLEDESTETRVVLITGNATVDSAVDALRGADSTT